MTSWSLEFLNVAKALSPFLMGAATAVLGKAAQYALHAVKGLKLTNNAKANALIQDGLNWAVGEAETVMQKAVNMTNQTLTNPSKINGTWNAATMVQAFQQALTATENNLSAQAKSILTQQEPNLSNYLSLLIEAFVPLAPTKISAKDLAKPAAEPIKAG